MKRKPDALLLLALFFGVGLVISSLTHGGDADRGERMSASSGAQSQVSYSAVNQ